MVCYRVKANDAERETDVIEESPSAAARAWLTMLYEQMGPAVRRGVESGPTVIHVMDPEGRTYLLLGSVEPARIIIEQGEEEA